VVDLNDKESSVEEIEPEERLAAEEEGRRRGTRWREMARVCSYTDERQTLVPDSANPNPLPDQQEEEFFLVALFPSCSRRDGDADRDPAVVHNGAFLFFFFFFFFFCSALVSALQPCAICSSSCQLRAGE
jgi:hypothetical protein